MSLTPCDPRCWEAEGQNCNCACGGRNHGCSKTLGQAGHRSELPKRMIKKDGLIWELQIIGSYFDYLYQNRSADNVFNVAKTELRQKQPDIELKIKQLTKNQRAWAEVQGWFKKQKENIPNGAVGDYIPSGLWKLISLTT